MIYFTTFIFTLLLAHAARAVPTCGNVTSPEDIYDSMYDDEQLVFRTTAMLDTKYDSDKTATFCTKCKILATEFPTFKDIPGFPAIGGAYNIQSPWNCGKCWKLTSFNPKRDIWIAAIDASPSGSDFGLSTHAFNYLTGGAVPPPVKLDIEARPYASSYCRRK